MTQFHVHCVFYIFKICDCVAASAAEEEGVEVRKQTCCPTPTSSPHNGRPQTVVAVVASAAIAER